MGSIDDKIAWQWDIIKRNDSYINSTNTKAALLLTFSVASISALAYNCPKIWLVCGATLYKIVACIVFSVTFFLLASSARLAFNAIFPNTTPGNKSLISFVHIAKKESNPDSYYDEFSSVTKDELLRDLCHQSVVLSSIASGKFKLLSRSILWVKSALVAIGFVLLLLGSGLLIDSQLIRKSAVSQTKKQAESLFMPQEEIKSNVSKREPSTSEPSKKDSK
ncbi:MAG: hypothetical protein C0623_13540 [Desulfuromonas sp.]|nr:MAG: hypothetical protein C0623_13540 [Desulfuromonas sp.]